MRFASVADVHVGNFKKHGGAYQSGLNARCQYTIASLAAAVNEAAAAKCQALIVAGDLLDIARPEPQVIAAVQVALTHPTLEVFLMLGNHDMISSEQGDHVLGPFAAVPNVQVVERPRLFRSGSAGGVDLLLVPFEVGNAREWLPAAIREHAKYAGLPILVITHCGIIHDGTPRFLYDCKDAIDLVQLADVCAKNNVVAALCGNWHDRAIFKVDGVTIVQIGALNPTGWDNPGLRGYGTVALYDSTKGFSYCEVPGPRFLNIHDDTLPSPLPEGCQLFARVHYQGSAAIAEARISTWLEQGKIVSGETVADAEAIEAQARSAAAAARDTLTLKEALAAFVDKMPLDEGIDRAAVMARAERFLSGAT